MSIFNKNKEIPHRNALLLSIWMLLLPLYGLAQPSSITYSKLIFEPVSLTEFDLPLSNMASAEEGISQTEFTAPSNNAQTLTKYLDSLQELESTQSPYFLALTEPLISLSQLYQENGDYDQAITLLERAQHIKRVNLGLFTPEQIPLVESIISNHESQNDFAKIHQLQGYLYYINQRNYQASDPELLNAQLNWGKWNIEAYFKNPTAIDINALHRNNFDSFNSGSPLVFVRDPITREYIPVPRNALSSTGINQNPPLVNIKAIIDPHLLEAQDLFQSLLNQEQEPEEASAAENNRHSLQLQLANVSFQIKSQLEELQHRVQGLNTQRNFLNPPANSNYMSNKKNLENIILSLKEDGSSSPLDISMAQIDLADWILSYNRYKKSYSLYQQAYSGLIDAGYSQNEAQSIFSPSTVVTIPSFANHRYTRNLWNIPSNQPLIYKGFIDVQFEFYRGSIRRLKVINRSDNTPTTILRLLLNKLGNETLRPPVFEGKVLDKTDLALRYYYTY